MMLKQVVLAHFEPVATRFGSCKIPKCLVNGPFWDQQWVKNGSKTCFSKSDPGPFGMLKQVFLARFEPVLTEFSPFHHMYAPLCALRTYLRAVWWSHLELGEGCRLEDIYIYIYIYICIPCHSARCRPRGWDRGYFPFMHLPADGVAPTLRPWCFPSAFCFRIPKGPQHPCVNPGFLRFFSSPIRAL